MEPYTNTDTDHSDTVNLHDYLKVLFRHKAVIITTFITVMTTVIIGLQFKTPVYEAQVKMLISAEKRIDAPFYKELMGYGESQIILTQSEMVRSRPVIERAVKAIGLYKKPPDYEKRFCSPLKKIFIDLKAKIKAKIKAKMPNKKLAHLTEKEKKRRLFS